MSEKLRDPLEKIEEGLGNADLVLPAAVEVNKLMSGAVLTFTGRVKI